jgi:hypothetical protein
MDETAAPASSVELASLLDRLHEHKDAAYGDAWRKRGEVIAIFANIARKYDRLFVAVTETRAAATEALADTVADLCIYTLKYLTWIADEDPSAFDAANLPVRADTAADRCGPDAVRVLLAALVRTAAPNPPSRDEGWSAIRGAFQPLEAALLDQAAIDRARPAPLDLTDKAHLVWRLAADTFSLLQRLELNDAAALYSLRAEVARMDAGRVA